MDQSKRPRRRLRSLLPRETGPRKPRRRSLARTEQEPRDEDPEPEVDERYRDAAGVWQGGRDGYGWQRYGEKSGDLSTGEITFMNRRDQ